MKRLVAATDAVDGRAWEDWPRSTRQAPIDWRLDRMKPERRPTLYDKVEPSVTMIDLR